MSNITKTNMFLNDINTYDKYLECVDKFFIPLWIHQLISELETRLVSLARWTPWRHYEKKKKHVRTQTHSNTSSCGFISQVTREPRPKLESVSFNSVNITLTLLSAFLSKKAWGSTCSTQPNAPTHVCIPHKNSLSRTTLGFDCRT